MFFHSPHMRNRIMVHVVWTTRDRRPLLDLERAMWLAEALPRVARRERAELLELGIVSTHLHLVLLLHQTTVIPRLLQRMKGLSAHAAKIQWAKGYSIESVSLRHCNDLIEYVRNQHLRHPEDAIVGFPLPPSGEKPEL